MIKQDRYQQHTMALLLTLFLASSVGSSTAQARDNNDYQFGGYVSLSSASVDDPDGKVGSSVAFDRIGANSLITLNRKTLMSTNIFYFDHAFDSTTTTIGQNVKGYGLAVQYYKKMSWSRSFQPYLGGGIALSSFDYTQRHTVSSDGFVDVRHGNRSLEETTLQLTSMVIQDWATSKKLFYRLSYERPLNTGIEGLFFDIGLMM